MKPGAEHVPIAAGTCIGAATRASPEVSRRHGTRFQFGSVGAARASAAGGA